MKSEQATSRLSSMRFPPSFRYLRVVFSIVLCICLFFNTQQSPAQSSTDTGSSTVNPLTSEVSLNPKFDIDNPINFVQDAAESVPGFEGGVSTTIKIMVLLTVLTLAPSILILCTSFIRIVIVLSLLRQAIGTQQLPPSQVIVGLSLFMTFMVMAPTFQQINENALQPLSAGTIQADAAWERAKDPLRNFMLAQIERSGNQRDVLMIMDYRGLDITSPGNIQWGDIDMLTLIPSFILSELKTAFMIGFRIYLPFLIIDMVISSLLISMGMLMLPPVLISLPFKLLLFVLVDGWRLIIGNLLESFTVIAPLLSG